MPATKIVKITPEIHARLADIARKERRSATAQLDYVLDTHLPALPKAPAQPAPESSHGLRPMRNLLSKATS